MPNNGSQHARSALEIACRHAAEYNDLSLIRLVAESPEKFEDPESHRTAMAIRIFVLL